MIRRRLGHKDQEPSPLSLTPLTKYLSVISNFRLIFLFCIIFSGLVFTKAAHANVSLDIASELSLPGVKLLAVEFFATWCKPCMEAVPRWNALHKKYQKDGLRFIVVVSRDANGTCRNPGWTPDQVICDDDGFLQDRFGADALPSAFLWDWQGQLLTQRGHVDEIEKNIVEWMRSSPRVIVNPGPIIAGSNISRRQLAGQVRTLVAAQGKLTVVAGAKERQQLRKLVADSNRNASDAQLACEIGKEVSANYLLKASIGGQSQRRLRLELFSAERGCLEANAVAPWNSARPQVAISQALATMTRRLKLNRIRLPFNAQSKSSTPNRASPLRQTNAPAVSAAKAVSLGQQNARLQSPNSPSQTQLRVSKGGFRPSWALFGIGGAAAIGAASLFFVADMNVNNANQNTSVDFDIEGARQGANTLRSIATGTAITSGALLGTGLILELIRNRQSRPRSLGGLMPIDRGVMVHASGTF